MSNKSYNIMRHEGIDDMDYVEELGLDPALAYTPEINEAIIKNIEANNFVEFMAQGMSEAQATQQSEELAKRGRANVAKGTEVLEGKGY